MNWIGSYVVSTYVLGFVVFCVSLYIHYSVKFTLCNSLLGLQFKPRICELSKNVLELMCGKSTKDDICAT